MLYGREATTLSLLGAPLTYLDDAGDPRQYVKTLVEKIVDIQAAAYTSAYKIKSLELSPSNVLQAPCRSSP